MSVAAADPVDRQDSAVILRWSISLVAVLVLHVAVAWAIIRFSAPNVELPPPLPPAAFLDLPPLIAGSGSNAPLQPPSKTPPATAPVKPAVQEVKPPPPKPPAQEAKPQPQAKPPDQAVAPQSLPQRLLLPVPLPQQPVTLPSRPAPKPQTAALPPSQGLGPAAPLQLDAVRAWQLGVIDRIEKFKAWPPEAIRFRLTGVVGLRLVIDRQGNILSFSLTSSSGFDTLDQATLGMARRAQRLPALPPQIPGEVYEFVLSVRWL